MGLYSNNNGVLTPIAGRGRAEYGASHYERGTASVEIIDGSGTLTVTFEKPFPNANYVIVMDSMTLGAVHSRITKYATGFTCTINCNTNVNVDWYAFKLYTDTEYNGLLNNQLYSTSEINTGKKWIDGKPIYRKVIDIGTLPDTTTKSVAHGITNFDLCISLVGVVKNSTSRLTIPSVWNDATETIGIYANGTSVIVSTSKDRGSFSGYAILEYTKTTD